MSNRIQASLEKLHQSVIALEQSASQAEQSFQAVKKSKGQKQPQNDLFSLPSSVKQNNPDVKALASRLDGAISKVERLLKEGDQAHG